MIVVHLKWSYILLLELLSGNNTELSSNFCTLLWVASKHIHYSEGKIFSIQCWLPCLLVEGCCDLNSTFSRVYIFGEQLSSFVFLFKDSWTLDLRTRLERFLSLTLKARRTPRLLTLFVSFWENTSKIIRITIKRQYNLLEESAAKIYCTIAVTLQFSVFMIGNIVYVPHSKSLWKKLCKDNV